MQYNYKFGYTLVAWQDFSIGARWLRIFADDPSIFYSSNELQRVINEELYNVLKYGGANMLSTSFKKTNYMIIDSPKKKTNISITTCHIEQKSQINYLGVFIDEHLRIGMPCSLTLTTNWRKTLEFYSRSDIICI